MTKKFLECPSRKAPNTYANKLKMEQIYTTLLPLMSTVTKKSQELAPPESTLSIQTTYVHQLSM